MNRIRKYMILFWVDAGQPLAFHRLSDVISYLNGLKVGAALAWRMGRQNGFETMNRFVSLYRGNENGGIVSALLPDERIEIEEGLLEQYA